MFRSSLIFHRLRTSLVRAQSNKTLTEAEIIAKYKQDMERVKQDPKLRALLEENIAEAKRKRADPNYKPVEVIPPPDWEKKFKEQEEEIRKHSAY
ncbi:MAG: hypothetical protein K0Q57_112 [Gammaproteobacteria bacterium]|jgi:hypothetical protein|nr:hypothetical protein [Gammaproteobacteria bacterium]